MFFCHPCLYSISRTINFNLHSQRRPGLPDFSWYMIPKAEKNVPNEHETYQMVIKYPKCKIFQTDIKYIHSKALQNLPNLGILVWKQTIWQPWRRLYYSTPPPEILFYIGQCLFLPFFSTQTKHIKSNIHIKSIIIHNCIAMFSLKTFGGIRA
jgi:hypothetical protein